MSYLAVGEPVGQGWGQIADFGVAFGLSALIGLERDLKQKAAGVRTYTVVGLASALFMLISKYGFTDVLSEGRIVLDPSRVAAQIVSGVGFIGGGIIFVKRDAVRGLTTAASIWLTAAVGAGAGAGLLVLSSVATAAYLVAILLLPPIARAVARRIGAGQPYLRVRYLEGRGLLRDVLEAVTHAGFSVSDLATTHSTQRVGHGDAATKDPDEPRSVEVGVQLGGRGQVESLFGVLTEIDGVLEVSIGRDTEI